MASLTSSTDPEAAINAVVGRERTGRYAVEDDEGAARAVLARQVVSAKRAVVKAEMARVLGLARPPSAGIGRPYSADDGVGVASPPVPSPPRNAAPTEGARPAPAAAHHDAVAKELRFTALLDRDAKDAAVRASLSAQERTANASVAGRLRALRQTRSS
eukprot:CAMPEP_0174835524 /NCGR_PEP_ID=MMETSP1114-20130205/5451_1 /TAXON_ID=312471 /ORGANISM="Neobodo designis, Strain CCAP 1951/1" /LENGTH=158 /DNA_ID=CAMNT_0016069475 /DNA_START=45 /DNA_END=521 /DNA_ORIENTATION=-